ATTWSCTAERERWPDHPYARYFTTWSRSPALILLAIVSRLTSGKLSASVTTRAEELTSCCIAAPIRRLLRRVRCRVTARGPLVTGSSLIGGASSTAATGRAWRACRVASV